METISKIISSFDLPALLSLNVGPNLLFAVLFLILLILYGLSIGRTRALISLLGIYIAFVLQSIFPYFDDLENLIKTSLGAKGIQAAIFLLAYIIVFLVLNRSLVKKRLTLKEASIAEVVFISFLQLGLLTSILTNILGSGSVIKIPDTLVRYFSGQQALFFWFLTPISALIFIRNRD